MALYEETRRPKKCSLPAHLSKGGPLPRSFLRYERHGVEKRSGSSEDGSTPAAAVARLYFLYVYLCYLRSRAKKSRTCSVSCMCALSFDLCAGVAVAEANGYEWRQVLN